MASLISANSALPHWGPRHLPLQFNFLSPPRPPPLLCCWKNGGGGWLCVGGGVQLRAHCNVLALLAVAEEKRAANANDRRLLRRK